ncbi:hypothetical protein T10_6574 [Trichinella papuae]|uniref:Uncharacterized protein n=1 Tax=Trichinella papuae TaxID=268474 RepID=A0A0V1M5H6_9BILA|nr:hypothetical protein T10_6574 [Trichinella papuae]
MHCSEKYNAKKSSNFWDPKNKEQKKEEHKKGENKRDNFSRKKHSLYQTVSNKKNKVDRLQASIWRPGRHYFKKSKHRRRNVSRGVGLQAKTDE